MKVLGKQTKLGVEETLKPNPQFLEAITVPSGLLIDQYTCSEFTSLCPITGQPDFGEIRIKLIRPKYLIESKSLKLYLFTYRNFGYFHEEICALIAKHIWSFTGGTVFVLGKFVSRGGVAISPIAVWPKNVKRTTYPKRNVK